MTVPEVNGNGLKSVADGEQLLPRIPNEITLEDITTKLSWKDFHVLQLVNRCWYNVIKSRQVYDTRVRSKSTETLVFHNGDTFKNEDAVASLALYSIRENRSHALPPIPHLDRGFPRQCGCVTLDGRIYVLGGKKATSFSYHSGSNEVFVLDLAVGKQWKQCASMRDPRYEFGCGVIDGKIYVFGGLRDHSPVYGSEVYDPKEDTWSPIKPMASMRFSHDVATVGDRFFVHGGEFFNPANYEFRGLEDSMWDPDDDDRVQDAKFWEVYHPQSDEWIVLTPFLGFLNDGIVFVSRGKLHLFTNDAIYVHDVDKKSWAILHTCTFGAIVPTHSVYLGLHPLGIVALDDELLAFVFYTERVGENSVAYLVHGRGLGGGSKEIVWEKTHYSLAVFWLWSLLLCPIHL